ncbi:type II toxin-antitoxin system RelE/ParE family toxin [Bradyrhizobium sp.]|uniref:type II toxin-antitoxin system RelE/ParE family toxin n=1 Tax=Bradyrhizobium sp. TaxID=376 RepID=UPI003520E25D
MKVRFTRRAQRDLAQIHDYISDDSPDIATRFVSRLVERSRELADNPFQGYLVTGDEIHVTHIRHTSRRRPPGWGR